MLAHQMIVSRVRISVNHAHVLSGFPLHYFARCEYVRADEHVRLSPDSPKQRFPVLGTQISGARGPFALVGVRYSIRLEAGTPVRALVWCDYTANMLILLSRLWCWQLD